ncbi:MAG TPA: alpha/beta hydrolase [Candidatus Corynebacterium intestinavium]|uniref:Alpha/beta hydrolase n=1 Tax=Candidatus Corynebacterium intestinavium TaxID=2838531 RepID=A0A9D2UB85_9CORY|nr:alpha/beta hydrolase [Candidatus Corynebacterium intestinavium]
MPTPEAAQFTTEDQWFESHGERCAARIFRPTAAGSENRPAIVMGHGFGTPRALGLYRYAEAFAAAGYIVVVFDYRYFGESTGQPRQLLDIRKQIEDWRLALAFTRSLDGVDATRIIGWGTSFAGGHVLSLAGARKNPESFAALIAQVPHISGPAAVRAVGLRSCLRVAPVAAADLFQSIRGAKPRYINSVGHPGELGVMTTPDAVPGKDAMMEASGLTPGEYPETVAARVLAWIGFYSPGARTKHISCPSLVQVMDQDAVTPTIVAVKAALKIPNSTVRIHHGGHFDPYVEPTFDEILSEQLEFLQRTVPVV